MSAHLAKKEDECKSILDQLLDMHVKLLKNRVVDLGSTDGQSGAEFGTSLLGGNANIVVAN